MAEELVSGFSKVAQSESSVAGKGADGSKHFAGNASESRRSHSAQSRLEAHQVENIYLEPFQEQSRKQPSFQTLTSTDLTGDQEASSSAQPIAPPTEGREPERLCGQLPPSLIQSHQPQPPTQPDHQHQQQEQQQPPQQQQQLEQQQQHQQQLQQQQQQQQQQHTPPPRPKTQSHPSQPQTASPPQRQDSGKKGKLSFWSEEPDGTRRKCGFEYEGDISPNVVGDLARRGSEFMVGSPEKPKEASATASQTPDNVTKGVAAMVMEDNVASAYSIPKKQNITLTFSKNNKNEPAHKNVIADNNNSLQAQSASQESFGDTPSEAERQNH